MKFLVLLSLVALCYARRHQSVQQSTVPSALQSLPYQQQYQGQKLNPLYQYNKEYLGQYQQQQYGQSYPYSYGQNSPQWSSQIPSTNQYYQYIQQYQELYQQGVWPVISQIYEQLTPSQTVALESLITRIGFQNVEVLFNYLVGNSFHVTPEQHQTLVSVIQRVGYPVVQEILQEFAGQRFYLGYQQNYVTFRSSFTLETILQELQQYSVRPSNQYFGQQYPRQTPYSGLSYQQWFSQVPSINQYYKYIQQYQQLYQQGVWPIISQIYEQLTPSQTVALETLISRIGYQHVEILFNYLAGNTFDITPEQYQTLVSVIQQVGYTNVQEYLQQFAGERFELSYPQNYVSFRPTFSVENILQLLQQYSVRPVNQYFGQQYPGQTSYGRFPFQQWSNQLPSSSKYFQFIQQYQQYYQQGLSPIISQIYEQMTPSQYAALETLISRIGFQNVEILLNYLAGNSFYFTPEQYQNLVSVIQQVGYPVVQEFLQMFAGERFYLGYQQKYVTLRSTFALEDIIQQLQQYSVRPVNFGQRYPQQIPYSGLSNQQWFSQVPSTNQYYQYVQQYQYMYQQGLWPIISQIYEQFTPSQYAALEALISRIGFLNVEVLFNYLAGNSFDFTPEQYQTFVSVIEQVGHPVIEKYLQVFAGERFYLGYQQSYITFRPTFTLQYILQQLQQYSVGQQYYGQQYPQYQQTSNYQRQAPYSSSSFLRWFLPYYRQYQGNQLSGNYPYQQYQNYQRYQPQYQSYQGYQPQYHRYQGYQPQYQSYQGYQYQQPQMAN